MSRRSHLTRSRSRLLAILFVLSAAALLLPGAWTGRLISLVQILVPFQDATLVVADSVSGAFGKADPPVPHQTHQAVQRANDALEHQVAALSARVADLEEENRILAGTRLWAVDGRRIGAHGRLIPARVVTSDMLPWRSSRLINAGSLQGVKRGDAVTSQHFGLEPDEDGGVRDGLAILLAETLIGIVEQGGTHTSRIKLLSDPDIQMKVRIGRVTDSGFVGVDRFFWLTGRGGDAMEIGDVDRRDVQEGLLQEGDVVLSDPTSEMLPAAMIIGKVVSIRPDRDNPLLRILTIQSPIDPESLRRVYVYDPDTGAND